MRMSHTIQAGIRISMASYRKSRRLGFTLVELLAVVFIVGILALLALGPVIGTLKTAGASAKCTSNLRQIGAAFYMFAAENNGQFPFVSGDSTAPTSDAQDGKGQQWDMQLRPYLGVLTNKEKSPMTKTVYYCPASVGDPSYEGTSAILLSYTYNVNVGKSETALGLNAGRAFNYSTVMLLADVELASSTNSKSYVPKMGQGRNNTIVFRPGESYYKFLAFRHRKAINILFLDGHVAPHLRLVDDKKSSPPENVRWTPDGPLTGSR